MKKCNIVISPSGQLYGSENVLLDFLKGSVNEYEIYAPHDSVFHKKLLSENFHVKGFENLKWLYFKLYFKLLFFKKNLYLNEAGHISYVKLLAKLLPFRKFVISVRLLEDCNYKLNTIPANITLIPVSNYIKDAITTNGNIEVIYDPYSLSNPSNFIKGKFEKDNSLVIGIVGRVIKTKGLDDLLLLMTEIKIENRKKIKIYFYGSYNQSSEWFLNFKKELDSIEFLYYSFKGFNKEQKVLYNEINLILHLNKVEALGRIIFEAIDYETPFLCYNTGGTGELARQLGVSSHSIDITTNTVNEFALRIEESIGNLKRCENDFQNAKKIILEDFNSMVYAMQIERNLK